MKSPVLSALLVLAAALSAEAGAPAVFHRVLRQGRRGHTRRHLRHQEPPPVPILGPPVNDTNMLAVQKAELFNMVDCQGSGAEFTSSANAFLTPFAPYVGNLWSVKFCGKGTFFFYATPDMQTLSVLGHVTRCGEEVTKHLGSCQCVNLPPETRALVQSFTLQYC